MIYSAVKLCSWIACNMPPAMRRGLGDVIGELLWPVIPRRRKEMAVTNVMVSLGLERTEAETIAKRSATRFGRMLAEVLYFPQITKDNIGRYISLQGKEHLEEALHKGRGVVLATAHSGNWELLGAALALNGFPLTAVVQKQTNAAMDRFINEYRMIAGMHITYKTGVRDMVRVLNEGKIVGLLMDQNGNRNGVFVDFFGRPASTAQGAAALARMNDTPVVPAFITENPDGTHTAIIKPAVTINKTRDRDRDIHATTQELTGIIEQHIRQHPHEWFWLHNRWKTQPPAN
jgi:KDO2-lipid IV(A) lauroyltransferase